MLGQPHGTVLDRLDVNSAGVKQQVRRCESYLGGLVALRGLQWDDGVVGNDTPAVH